MLSMGIQKHRAAVETAWQFLKEMLRWKILHYVYFTTTFKTLAKQPNVTLKKVVVFIAVISVAFRNTCGVYRNPFHRMIEITLIYVSSFIISLRRILKHC